MGLDFWILYFLAVNAAGFLLFALSTLIRKKTANIRIDFLWMIAALLGGSVGTLISMLIFNRKAEKDNMMSKVFLSCVVVVQAVVVLFVNGFHRPELNFDIIDFFSSNKFLIIYLIAINILPFIVFAIDKYKAVKEKSRVRIVTLLSLSFFGGAVGGLAAMYIFRHKTKVNYFTVGLPLMIVTHLILIFYFMNI